MRPLAILLATLPMLAQVPSPAPPRPQHNGPNALGLSAEQQTQIKAIRQKHQEVLKADHQAMREQNRAFRAAMEDPKTTEAQLRAAFDQVNARRFQALVERRAMRQEIRAVLTPDQQAQADAMKARFRERHRARMERRIAFMQHRLDQEGPAPAPESPSR